MTRRLIRYCDIKTVFLIALMISISSTAFAGTICGTVRDIDTLAPVDRAGIFVRTQEGAYTGYHGATSEAGTFCIDEIPAGTYDLEIAVDDYETRYVRGVEVTDETTDVDIDIFETEHFLYAPWPNPAQTSVTFRYRVGDPVPVRLQIYDVRGCLIRGWENISPSTGVHHFNWDLRGRDGTRVASGVYFARFSAGSVSKIRVIVTLH
ncbi:carboxypeptidase regulatory-like domain-containing protein [bacterium]|nr:carboxypeptidase regulatory-like domain-containing protein [bacterium]